MSGWIFAGHQIGAVVASFGAGLSRVILLSYVPAFFTAGVLCSIASMTVLLIRLSKKVSGVAAVGAAR